MALHLFSFIYCFIIYFDYFLYSHLAIVEQQYNNKATAHTQSQKKKHIDYDGFKLKAVS